MNCKKVLVLIMTIGTMALASFGQTPNIKIRSMREIGWENTFVPQEFTAGDTVTINYSLINDSAFSAGAFNVGLRVGGTIVARNSYPELVNGGEASGHFAWIATCGEPVQVVADCDGAVAESNEGDNVMTDPGLACSQPNLMFFRNLSCSSGTSTAKAGLPYEFRATMHADLVGARDVRVTGGVVGGARLYDHTFAELAAEALQDVSFVWEVPEGAHRVYFDFDPDNTVSESNERDNRQELAITAVVSTPATEPYDIRTSINKAQSFGLTRISRIEVKQGKPLTIRGEVSGTTGAVRDIKITAWVQSGKTRTQLYEQDFSSIASLTVPFSFPWTPAVVGENTLVVKAELGPHAVGAGVVDSNPRNNTAMVRVTVLEVRPRLR
ncbi:MAG TPA: CARDB domain-containing protein [Patescibacteria group bacterium]|nr:CARDB domain-containing protein [Patescibacteria group bacterium]